MVREDDVGRTPETQQPIRPPVSAAPAAGGSPPEDGSRRDVLLVCPPAARDAEGGRREIEALVDLFVVETRGTRPAAWCRACNGQYVVAVGNGVAPS